MADVSWSGTDAPTRSAYVTFHSPAILCVPTHSPTATSDTVEATDRFGSVLTLRLVRQALTTASLGASSTTPKENATSSRGHLHTKVGNTYGGNRVSQGDNKSISSTSTTTNPKIPQSATTEAKTHSASRAPSGGKTSLYVRENHYPNARKTSPYRGYRALDGVGVEMASAGGVGAGGGGASRNGLPGLKYLRTLLNYNEMDAIEVRGTLGP